MRVGHGIMSLGTKTLTNVRNRGEAIQFLLQLEKSHASGKYLCTVRRYLNRKLSLLNIGDQSFHFVMFFRKFQGQ